MAEGSSYCSSTGFHQFRSRTDEMQTVCGFFQQKIHGVGFASATSFLSLGAGVGDLDAQLVMKCLPQLETYIGVECSAENMILLRQELNDVCASLIAAGKLKIALKLERVEEYAGPNDFVDVVFMNHLLYYTKQWAESISRGYSWLKPGGRLIIGVVEDYCFLQKLANINWITLPSWRSRIISSLDECGLPYTEHVVSHTFNTEGVDHHFADFIMCRKATEEEVEWVMANLPKLCQPETRKIQHATHFFIVTSPSEDATINN